jgi:hypothetical protein
MSTGPINSHPGASEMAEISDGYSTDDCRGFSLLRTWYIYILDELTHVKGQADIIVQRFFQDGEYDLFNPDRRRFKLGNVVVVPGGKVPLPSQGEFWHSHPTCGIECKIDGLTSSARRTEPASGWWRARGRQFSEHQIDLIWVNDAAMVDFLRGVGFPLTQFDAAQPELPLAEPIHNSPPMGEDTDAPPAPEPTPAPAPEWDPHDPSAWASPDTVMLNLGFGLRARRIRAIIVECLRLPQHPSYRGESIPDILDAIGSAELDRFLFPKNKRAESGKRTDSSCERFLAAWKAWRSRYPVIARA